MPAVFAAPASEPMPLSRLAEQLPEDLGRVQEVFESRGPAVILIQDAHGIPEAQRSIRGLVSYFHEHQGAGLAAAEGASGPLRPDLFTSYPDHGRLTAVLETYLDRGELTGISAAALSGMPAMDFLGVEDWGLYEQGLGLMLAALEREEFLLQQLAGLRENLEKEKERLYSPRLRKLDQVLRGFHAGQEDLLTVLEILSETAPPPAETLIAALLHREPVNASEEGDVQMRRLAASLRSRLAAGEWNLPPGEVRTFHENEQAFQTASLSPEAFGLFLRGWCRSNRISVSIPVSMAAGIERERKIKSLEGTQLLREFETYSRSVKEKLFESEEERSLDRRTERLDLAERFVRMEISRPDWDLLQVGALKGLSELQEEDFRAHRAFYENAQRRDEAFVRNLESGLRKSGTKTALFAAGGFHTEGVKTLLRQKGFSYAVVTPEIRRLPETSAYRDHLRGSFSWKNYFKTERGRVDLYAAFTRALRDQLLSPAGSVPPQGIRLWRDQLIRGLSRQGALTEFGGYAAYLDEVSAPASVLDGTASDQFLKKLHELDLRGKADEAGIFRLLQRTAIASPEAASLAVRARLRPPGTLLREAQKNLRSELRASAEELETSEGVDLREMIRSVVERVEEDERWGNRPEAFRSVVFQEPFPVRLKVKVRASEANRMRARLASVGREVKAASFWSEMMYALFREILMNAKDGRDKGKRDIPLDLEVFRDGNDLVLRFRDEGPGIAEEVLRKKLDHWDPASRYSTKEKRPRDHGVGFDAIYRHAAAAGGRAEWETVTAVKPLGFKRFKGMLEPGARIREESVQAAETSTTVTVRIPVESGEDGGENQNFEAYLKHENPKGVLLIQADDFDATRKDYSALRGKLRGALKASKTILVDAGSFASVPGGPSPWGWTGSALFNDDALERMEEKIRILGAQTEGAYLDLGGAPEGIARVSLGDVVRELLKNAVYHGNQLEVSRYAAYRVQFDGNQVRRVEAFDHGVLEPAEYQKPRVPHTSIAMSGERAFLGMIQNPVKSSWAFEGALQGGLLPVEKITPGVSRVSVIRANADALGRESAPHVDRSELRTDSHESVRESAPHVDRSELRSSVHESMMGPLIYPRTILNGPEDSRYSQPYFFEAPVLPAAAGDKAMVMFEAAMREYVRVGAQHPRIAARAKKLARKTTVLAVDLPNVFYSSGERIGITHVLQISMRRRAILISKKFLENLDPAKPFDRKLAAFYLDAGQVLIEKYDDLQDYFRYENQNHGVVSRKLYAVYRSVEQTLASDASWDQEAFLGNVNFDPSDAELKHLRKVDAELRKLEKARLLENQAQLLRNDDEIRRILSAWDPVNGYSDDEIPEVSRRVAEVVPGSISPGESMQQNALRALQRTIQSFQKRAVYFEAEGDPAAAAAYFARAEEIYRASQKLDFGGLFPLRVQEELIYFLLRSGNLEALERELIRLNNVHYVPMSRRPYQMAVHEMAYPLWLIPSAPDLLYKLQYYRLGSDAKRIGLIERIEKTLTRAYFRELKESNDGHKKFAVDLRNAKADELKSPLLIPVPESGDVLSFAWEKMQISPRHIEVRLTAAEWLNGPEEQETIAYLDFTLLQESPDKWSARTSLSRQWPAVIRGQEQFPLMISDSALAEFRGIPAVLLQLALRLARESGAGNFSFRLPIPVQQRYELPYRDKRRHFHDPLNFKKLQTSEIVDHALRAVTARQPASAGENGGRSELRSDIADEGGEAPILRLVQDAVYEAGPSGRGQKTWVFSVERKTGFGGIFTEISKAVRLSTAEIKRHGGIFVVQKEAEGRYKISGMGRVDLFEPDSEMWLVPAGTLLKVVYEGARPESSAERTADDEPNLGAEENLIREAELLVIRLRPDLSPDKARSIAEQLVSITDYPGRSMAPLDFFIAEAIFHLFKDFILAVIGGFSMLFVGLAVEGLMQALGEAGAPRLPAGWGFLSGAAASAFVMSAFYAPWFFYSAFHGHRGVSLYLRGDIEADIARRDPEVMSYFVHEWVHALEYQQITLEDRLAASAEALRRYELSKKQTAEMSPESFSDTIRGSKRPRSNSWPAFLWQGHVPAQKKREFLRGYRAAQKAFEVSAEEARLIYEALDSEKLFDYRGYRFVQSLILKMLPGFMENYARAFRLGGAAAALSDRHGIGTGWRFLKELAAGRSAHEAFLRAVPRSELRSVSEAASAQAAEESLKDYTEDRGLLRDAHAVFVVKSSSGQTQRDERMKALHAGRTPEERKSAPVGRNMIRGPEQGLLVRAALDTDEISEEAADKIQTDEPTGFSVSGDSYAYTAFNRVEVVNFKTGVRRTLTHPQFAHLHTVVFSPSGRELLVTSPGFEKIFEMDAESGAVLWEWSAWDHGYSRSSDGSRIYSIEKKEAEASSAVQVTLGDVLASDHKGFGIPTWYRAVHLNDASYDSDGNILATLFYPGQAVKIRRSDGKITNVISGLSKPHGFLVLKNSPGPETYVVTSTGAFENAFAAFYDRDFKLLKTITTRGLADRKEHLADFPDWQWIQYTVPMTPQVSALVDVVRSRLYLVDRVRKVYRAVRIPKEWSLQTLVPVEKSFHLNPDPEQETPRSELREETVPSGEENLRGTARRTAAYLEGEIPETDLGVLAQEIHGGVEAAGFEPFALAVRGASLEIQRLRVKRYLDRLSDIVESVIKSSEGDAVLAFDMSADEKDSLEDALAQLLIRSGIGMKIHAVVPRELSQMILPKEVLRHSVSSVESISPAQLQFARNARAIPAITGAGSQTKGFRNDRVYALRSAEASVEGLDPVYAAVVDKAARAAAALVLAAHMKDAAELKDQDARARLLAAVNGAFFAGESLDENTYAQILSFDADGIRVQTAEIFRRLSAEAASSEHLGRSA